MELLKDKSLQLEFTKQGLCHFCLRTRKEHPVISDLSICNLLAFYTTYLFAAAFSKLIIIKSKNRSFLKNVENVLRCHASIYKWMIGVKIIKRFYPFTFT